MDGYTQQELEEALRVVSSAIKQCEKRKLDLRRALHGRHSLKNRIASQTIRMTEIALIYREQCPLSKAPDKVFPNWVVRTQRNPEETALEAAGSLTQLGLIKSGR